MQKELPTKKGLIICPFCEMGGKKEILAEVKEDGTVEVLRFHLATTQIKASEYKIVCPSCGKDVFYHKQKKDDANYIWFKWVHRVAFA